MITFTCVLTNRNTDYNPDLLQHVCASVFLLWAATYGGPLPPLSAYHCSNWCLLLLLSYLVNKLFLFLSVSGDPCKNGWADPDAIFWVGIGRLKVPYVLDGCAHWHLANMIEGSACRFDLMSNCFDIRSLTFWCTLHRVKWWHGNLWSWYSCHVVSKHDVMCEFQWQRFIVLFKWNWIIWLILENVYDHELTCLLACSSPSTN